MDSIALINNIVNKKSLNVRNIINPFIPWYCGYDIINKILKHKYRKSKYNWIENDERISKIIDLTPSIHEIGISYFYSKEIDAFIENECNRNEESNLLIQFINEFDNIVCNAARDTLTHSNVKIIDRSSRMFPRNIRNKYAIICGFTSPGLFCTSISMDIGNSVFSLIDGIFFNSILNSINNINEIIKK